MNASEGLLHGINETDCFRLLISMVDQVPVDSPYETFSDVAKELFCDGIYNWGRIVTLFYFTYKLIMKVCTREEKKRSFLVLVFEGFRIINFECSCRMDCSICSRNRRPMDRSQRWLGTNSSFTNLLVQSLPSFFSLVGHSTRCCSSITVRYGRCFSQRCCSNIHGLLLFSTGLANKNTNRTRRYTIKEIVVIFDTIPLRYFIFCFLFLSVKQCSLVD